MNKQTLDKIAELVAKREAIDKEISELKKQSSSEVDKRLDIMRTELEMYDGKAVREKNYKDDNIYAIYHVDAVLAADGFKYKFDIARPEAHCESLYTNDEDNGEDDFDRVSTIGGVAVGTKSVFVNSVSEFMEHFDFVDVSVFLHECVDNFINVLNAERAYNDDK